MKRKRRKNRKKASSAELSAQRVEQWYIAVANAGYKIGQRRIELHSGLDHNSGIESSSEDPPFLGHEVYTFHVDLEVPGPPERFQRVLSSLLSADEREGALGDLAEKYRTRYRQVGPQKANRWFAFQVFRSLFPLLVRPGGRIVWLILGEWIKTHFVR